MEVEYIAAAVAAQEVVWLRNLIISLNVLPYADDAITLHNDNIPIIDSSNIPSSIIEQMHIDQVSLVRKRKKECFLTTALLSEPTTKPLPFNVFETHVKAMVLKMLRNIYLVLYVEH